MKCKFELVIVIVIFGFCNAFPLIINFWEKFDPGIFRNPKTQLAAFVLIGAVQELRHPPSKGGIWVRVCQRRRVCGYDDTNDLGGR